MLGSLLWTARAKNGRIPAREVAETTEPSAVYKVVAELGCKSRSAPRPIRPCQSLPINAVLIRNI